MKLRSLGAAPQVLSNCLSHKHDLWEFSVNVSGCGETFIDNICHPFSEGTILCIPPNMFHYKQSAKGFTDYFFHTDGFLTADGKEVPTDRPIVLQDDSEKSFETIVQLILNLYYQKKPEERTVVISLFQVAMQLLSVRITAQTASPLVDRIKSRIIASFTNPEINLSEILSKGNYSENYMRKKFKEQTGLTPMEYLATLRIDYAKQLLDQKKLLNLSIASIAEMCGYYDTHYFSRVFRRQTGLSPREYMLHGDLPSGSDEGMAENDIIGYGLFASDKD